MNDGSFTIVSYTAICSKVRNDWHIPLLMKIKVPYLSVNGSCYFFRNSKQRWVRLKGMPSTWFKMGHVIIKPIQVDLSDKINFQLDAIKVQYIELRGKMSQQSARCHRIVVPRAGSASESTSSKVSSMSANSSKTRSDRYNQTSVQRAGTEGESTNSTVTLMSS